MFVSASLTLFTIITAIIWIAGKASFDSVTVTPLLSVSQISALIGVIFFAFNFILATRLRILDKLAGGLDKVYRLHHTTGVVSFILLLNHPLLLAVNSIGAIEFAATYLLPSTNIPYTLGVVAIYLMIMIMFITLYASIPYEQWLFVHKLMGLPLLIGTLHVFLIPSDVSKNPILRIWILCFLGIAIVSYIYKLILYKHIGPKFKYRVSAVNRIEDVLEILLSPINKRMEYYPGQFVYFSVIDNKAIKNDEHPFSIASSEESENLKLGIKISGDYTLSLKELQEGNIVTVRGPYGQFGDKLAKESKDFLWIAGGIGVTPFLGFINSNKGNKTDFFYTTRKSSEAVYNNYILEQVADTNINYYYHESTSSGRLTAEVIQKKIGDIANKVIFICGPTPMMKDLRDQFMKLGIKAYNIIMEDFSFK